jgi:hypothetical protein
VREFHTRSLCSMDTVLSTRNVACPQTRPSAISRAARIYRAAAVRSKIPADAETAPATSGHLARSNPLAIRHFAPPPWRRLRCATRILTRGPDAMPAVRIHGGNVNSGVTSQAWRGQVSRRSAVLDVRSITCVADAECARGSTSRIRRSPRLSGKPFWTHQPTCGVIPEDSQVLSPTTPVGHRSIAATVLDPGPCRTPRRLCAGSAERRARASRPWSRHADQARQRSHVR